jgi:hypothetical protein
VSERSGSARGEKCECESDECESRHANFESLDSISVSELGFEYDVV